MNKTVNINLANTLFHIDEEAYTKMRRYLESIKRSFANTPGSDEILADIEARIAELFHERLENERQVITEKEVDEVITIMGQPEDYMVDEDIFEDEPIKNPRTARKKTRKLYRDIQTKYVAGVSSGLGHYFGIDPLWVRLLWIFLTLGSAGSFIMIYGLLWILIPEAETTSQQLDMRGEPVNISNIERKVKEGFDEVADKVKGVDYEKVGNKVKSSGKTFFDSIGDIILFFFKIFGKFIGILLIIIGASTVIGLFIGMLTLGTLDWISLPGIDNFLANTTETPIWLLSLFMFFAIGIPFFFLLYLGLKILVNNLKSIGNIAKFSLLGLWLLSLISLIVLGVREAASHAFSGSTEIKKELYVENIAETVHVNLISSSSRFDNRRNGRMDGATISYDQDGNEVLVLDDVRFNLKKSMDSLIRIEVRKESNGASFNEAKEKSTAIEYNYTVEGNTIALDDFLTTSSANKFKNQEVRVTLYLPAGSIIAYSIGNSDRCWTMRAPLDRVMNGCEMADYLWEMDSRGELICQNCPEEDEGQDDRNKIIIDENGIDIDIKDDQDSFQMKIDEDGISIKTEENK